MKDTQGQEQKNLYDSNETWGIAKIISGIPAA